MVVAGLSHKDLMSVYCVVDVSDCVLCSHPVKCQVTVKVDIHVGVILSCIAPKGWMVFPLQPCQMDFCLLGGGRILRVGFL